MARKTRQRLQEQLRSIEERLANAAEYVERGINVEGSTWLHLDDWRGNSGHPSWMKNHMIPTTMKLRAEMERALDTIDNKAREKGLARRRRVGAS
jgi:hypothetical protein